LRGKKSTKGGDKVESNTNNLLGEEKQTSRVKKEGKPYLEKRATGSSLKEK